MKYGGNILGLVQQQKAGNAQRAISGYGHDGYDAPERRKLTPEERKNLIERMEVREKAFESYKLDFEDATEIDSDSMDDLAEYSAKKCLDYVEKWGVTSNPKAYGAIESAELRFSTDKDNSSRVNFRKLDTEKGSIPETIAEVKNGEVNARSVEFISSGCVKQPGKDVFNYIYRETGESNHYGNYEALIVGVFNYNEQGNRIYDKKGIADRFDVDDFLTSHPEYQRLENGALPGRAWDRAFYVAFVRANVEADDKQSKPAFESIDRETYAQFPESSIMSKEGLTNISFDKEKNGNYFATIEKAALLTHRTQELIDEKLVEAKTLDVQSNWDNLSSIPFAGDQSA